MLNGFEKIVEERIQKAQRRGLFDNLTGAGKPLPKDVIGDSVAEDLRLSYRILKNADCLPPEMEVQKEIRRTEDVLAGLQETQERYRTLRRMSIGVSQNHFCDWCERYRRSRPPGHSSVVIAKSR